MIKMINKYECCGCGVCAQICPNKCISMQCDEEGFSYPIIDNSKCVKCDLCSAHCPIINSVDLKQKNMDINSYAAYNNNYNVLYKSSSGGIFFLLAKRVIDSGGVVCGAAFCNNFDVKHIIVSSINDLYLLIGSKYVQSDMGDIYVCIKEFLDKGKNVLFSGTPCQVEGLLSFLNKDYDNLLTVDFICSGVPSPLLWKDYLNYVEKKAHSQITNINFRYKKYGWQEYVLLLDYENGKQRLKTRFEDYYMRAFRAGYSLRPACFNCKFKKVVRSSDITLGDFWGIEKVNLKYYNHGGTSLLLVNSNKGNEFFLEIADQITFFDINRSLAVTHNKMIVESFSEPLLRKDFFNYYQTKSFVEAVKKYCKIPIKQRLRLLINSFLQKAKR